MPLQPNLWEAPLVAEYPIKISENKPDRTVNPSVGEDTVGSHSYKETPFY